jgi:hypothetical protein
LVRPFAPVGLAVLLLLAADVSTVFALDTSATAGSMLHGAASFVLHAPSVRYEASETIIIGAAVRQRSAIGSTTFPGSTSMQVSDGADYTSSASGLVVHTAGRTVRAANYFDFARQQSPNVLLVLTAYFANQMIDGRVLPLLIAGARNGVRHGRRVDVTYGPNVLFGPFAASITSFNGSVTMGAHNHPDAVVVHLVADPLRIDVVFSPVWHPAGQ